ncbi:hypothetical protein RIF29_27253 [Crotalaria pallida]|uniref:Uncharacterized protein n=1 Tax=Crotalaria pallida TaxID=3830 RepID=A0AAN9I5D9_CROPI
MEAGSDGDDGGGGSVNVTTTMSMMMQISALTKIPTVFSVSKAPFFPYKKNPVFFFLYLAMDELHENSRDDNVDKQRGKQTKKRKVQDDDDEEEEEHENTHDSDDDSSSTHKKGRVFWSQELHHNSNNYDQLKFQSAIGHRYQNVVQATPISKWFSDQFPDSLTDIHSQGVFSASTSKQVNNNMPFQWWDDHNQDASNYSNVIGSSMNSLTPMNGAVGPECHTSTNSTFNRNPDFYFGDPVQMKHEGIMEFNVGNSVKPQQVHTINQQESQKSCVANNVRSFEELIAASSSGSSQESAEIAELRKEMAETRYEHLKLKEMMVQQDRLLQTIIQFVCTMQQQPEPALNLH